MNLVLLQPSDFLSDNRVRLQGRTLKHVLEVHRATAGDTLRVGIVNGRIGHGRIESINSDGMEMRVQLEIDPPAPLPLRLILALPRPKVLNRVIAAATSMGIREIDLINAWRVEKSYWESPRLSDENLRLQSILGLEQAVDTVLPTIRMHKLFAPFVRDELPASLSGQHALLAHPYATADAPRRAEDRVVLAIGPEGGFIERELDTFKELGFHQIRLGPRILRVETALACLVGRLF